MPQANIQKGGNVDDLEIKLESSQVAETKVGDAVALTGSFQCGLSHNSGRVIFGQVTAINPGTNEVTVRYRGLCVFDYVGQRPFVTGRTGVEFSPEGSQVGRVQAAQSGAGAGTVIGIDEDTKTVSVIL